MWAGPGRVQIYILEIFLPVIFLLRKKFILSGGFLSPENNCQTSKRHLIEQIENYFNFFSVIIIFLVSGLDFLRGTIEYILKIFH